MKNINAILCFILLSFHGVNCVAEPIPDDVKSRYPQNFREYVKYSYDIYLPAEMSKALKVYNKTAKILKMGDFEEDLRLHLAWGSSNMSCHSAVFNDFNGDEKFDAAILVEGDFFGPGQNGKEKYFPLLAILSDGATSYQVVEITSIPAYKPVMASLRLVEPGRVTPIDGSEAVEIKNYGIMESEGYGATVYYWDDAEKKFKAIGTGGR